MDFCKIRYGSKRSEDSRGESSQEPRSRLLLAMSGFCMCSVGLPWNGCRGAVGSVTGNVFPGDTTEGTRRVVRVRECPSANPMHKKPLGVGGRVQRKRKHHVSMVQSRDRSTTQETVISRSSRSESDWHSLASSACRTSAPSVLG